MNSDCSSYVMICLCIGVAYDCVLGSGEANWRGRRSLMQTYKIKWNTAGKGGDLVLILFLLFFFHPMYFTPWWMVSGRG